MPTTSIEDIRRQYPQYDDLSDEELADGLYRKYYSDMPREKFNERIGLASPEPAGPEAPAAPMDTRVMGGSFEPGPDDETFQLPLLAGNYTTPVNVEIPGEVKKPFQVGVQGVGRGLANLAGAPVDLATLAMNTGLYGAERMYNMLPGEQNADFGRIREPVGGSNWIADQVSEGAEALGLDMIDRDEMSPAQRVFHRVNALGTEAAAGGAGLARRAATRAAPTPRYTRTPEGEVTTQPMSRTEMAVEGMTGPYRENAARAFRTDVAAGTGAGASMGVAEETLPEEYQTPLAMLFAGLGGGIGGATAATRGNSLVDMATNIRRYTSDPNIAPDVTETGRAVPVPRKVADKAGDFMQRMAVDPKQAARNIRDEADFRAGEGFPQSTSGLASRDTGLVGAEQTFRIQNRTPFTVRDEQIRSRAADEVGDMRPQDADPRRPTDMANRYRDEQVAANRQTVDAAEQQEQAARSRLGEAQQAQRRVGEEMPYDPSKKPGASETVDKTVVEDTMKPRTAEKNRRFQEIDPEGSVQRPTDEFVSTARAIRDRWQEIPDDLRGDIVPERLIRQIEDWAPQARQQETGLVDESGSAITRTVEESGTKSFRAMNEMRPALADAEKRARKNGYYLLADNLRKIKDEIGNEAQRIADEGGDAGYRAQDALDYHKTEFAPYFGRGAGGKLREAINKDDPTRTATPPTATAEKFLRAGRGGGKEAAQDLRRILEIAPTRKEGMNAAREYFLADLTKTLNNDGSVNPRKLRNWMQQREDVFQVFPEWRAEAQNLLRRATGAEQKATQLSRELDKAVAERKKAIRDAGQFERDLNKQSVALMFDAAPDKVMQRVYGSGDPEKTMQEIVDFVRERGGKQEMQGLKALVADDLIDRTRTAATVGEDQRAVSYAKLLKQFDKNEGVLNKVFTGDEMNSLRRARRLLEPFQRLNLQATRGSPTAEYNEAALRALEGALKGYYGVLQGGGYMRVLKLLGKSLPDDTPMVARLVERALFDPKVAEHLLVRDVSEAFTPRWQSKMLQMIVGAEAGRESGEREPLRIELNTPRGGAGATTEGSQ